MFRDLERAQTMFTGVAAHVPLGVDLGFHGNTISTDGSLVSGSYFPVLGINAALGRLLGPEDDTAEGKSPVAVLSHEYWKAHLGGSPSVLNETIVVNGQPLTIVGVTAAGFDGTTLGPRPAVYVPITLSRLLNVQSDGFNDRRNYWVYLFARMQPGVSIERAVRLKESAASKGRTVPRNEFINDVAVRLLRTDILGNSKFQYPGQVNPIDQAIFPIHGFAVTRQLRSHRTGRRICGLALSSRTLKECNQESLGFPYRSVPNLRSPRGFPAAQKKLRSHGFIIYGMASRWNENYAQGFKPWDSGVPDPMLIQVVESGALPVGRALDVGCGTGTNAIWLAQHGYEVYGVDVAPLAIEQARAKLPAGLICRFDALDFLAERPEGGPFELVFDRGCFHVFDEPNDRAKFAAQVAAVLALDGAWLSLIGSTEGPSRDIGPPRRSLRDVTNAIEPHLEILSVRSAEFRDAPELAKAWICLSRCRAMQAQPSTRTRHG